MDWTILFGLFALGLLPLLAKGKYISGHLKTVEDWEFLARFCFLSDTGRLQFEFEFPQDPYEPQNILLYFDEPDQWPAVYKSDKSCEERESPPHIKPENNQKIILHHNEYWSGCEVISNDTKRTQPYVVCNAGRSFYSARERWWFVAASRCTTNQTTLPGLNLKYKMWMTNGDDIWHKHFSADEFYILPVDIAFLIVMTLMLALSVFVALKLKDRQLFHTTYKMYMVSLSLECFYLFIMCIAYGKYANDGKDVYGLKTFGRVAEACGVLTFLLMLILMAKGYTITRGRLSTSGSIKIAVFMTLYGIVYAVLFIYEASFFDPGEVLYIYESPAGYGLIAMRLIGWIWFCYAIFFTLKHYPEKSKFYYPFFIFYTIWFWAGPVVILIAMKAMPLWVREKVVNGVERTVTFIGHGFFLILTRPSAANSNFPYHVRTSQIGIMNVPAQNGAPLTADKETESFSSHPYAPSAPPEYYTPNGHPNFTELFTVSQERSSQQQQPNGNYNQKAVADSFPHQNPANNPFIVTQ